MYVIDIDPTLEKQHDLYSISIPRLCARFPCYNLRSTFFFIFVKRKQIIIILLQELVGAHEGACQCQFLSSF